MSRGQRCVTPGSAEDAMPAQPFLLSLPAELLVMIVSHCSKEDLLNVRLVSKQLHAASLDAFAAAWTSHFNVFFLDPDRMQRLLHIFESPALARRVEQVILSLDPFEGKRPPNPIREGGCWYDPGLPTRTEFMEPYDQHAENLDPAEVCMFFSRLEGMSLGCPSKLKIELNMDCRNTEDEKREITTIIMADTDVLLSNILPMGLAVPLRSLKIEHMLRGGLDVNILLHALQSWSASLEEFEIENIKFRQQSEDADGSAKQHTCQIMETLLSCRRLEKLKLGFSYCNDKDCHSVQYLGLSACAGWLPRRDIDTRGNTAIMQQLQHNVEKNTPICADSYRVAYANTLWKLRCGRLWCGSSKQCRECINATDLDFEARLRRFRAIEYELHHSPHAIPAS